MRTARSSGRLGGLHQAPPGTRSPQEQTPRDQEPPGADPPGTRHPPDQAPPHGTRHSTPHPAARHVGIPPAMYAGIAPPPPPPGEQNDKPV